MWVFCCLGLIVMLLLALWPDPDVVRVSPGSEQPEGEDVEPSASHDRGATGCVPGIQPGGRGPGRSSSSAKHGEVVT